MKAQALFGALDASMRIDGTFGAITIERRPASTLLDLQIRRLLLLTAATLELRGTPCSLQYRCLTGIAKSGLCLVLRLDPHAVDLFHEQLLLIDPAACALESPSA